MATPTAEVNIPGLLEQLRAIKPSDFKDDVSRKAFLEAAQDAAVTVETPGDSISRIAYLSLQTPVARLGCDLKLFETLAKTDGSVFTTKELAETTKSDQVLLGRILRYLSSVGMIKEVDEDQWAANHITKTLSVPGLRAGIYHNHDYVSLCWQALPDFLAETNYQNPSDSSHSPFQKGHQTDLMAYEWALRVPSRFNNFMLWMAASREGQKMFLDVYPFEKELCHDVEPQTPLFVDVGGGIGHQCLALKQRLPHVPGRVILQDLPPMVSQAIPCEGVEHTVHDFMTEQPIKGARAYYFRNIMHDFPDDKCSIIIQHIIKAMDKDSVILIDDMILPNKGASWRQTQIDLTMMAGLAAMERTEKQWYSMLDAAGLKVKGIYTYTPELRDSIIVAVPK